MHNSEEAFRTIYGKMLEETRRNYRALVASQQLNLDFSFPRSLFSYYKMRKPFYSHLCADNRFNQLYRDQLKVYKHGRVVWGHLIQANNALFTKGNKDLPAAFIYSPDPIVDSSPHILANAAQILFDTKGKTPREDIREISELITDEIAHVWKLKVSHYITERTECYYTSNMIFRKHLPNRVLNGNLFPFLVCPEKTDVGFILPSRLWSKEFIERCW